MKTITVAGLKIKESAKDNFTYEQLFDLAKSSPNWLRVKNANKLIDKELKDNGYKPVKKNTKQIKANKQV